MVLQLTYNAQDYRYGIIIIMMIFAMQVPLGVLAKSETNYEEMIKILKDYKK